MPLDVQPLSAGRRIALIAAMLVLLGGSLGFADYLVYRRTNRPLIDSRFTKPRGTSWPPPVYSLDAVLRRRAPRIVVNIDSKVRGLMALQFTTDSGDSPDDWNTDLAQVVASVTANQSINEPVVVNPDVILGGRPALQTVAGITDPTGRQTSWWMVRLTESGGTGVAVCLSGDGVPTQADQAWFDDYCRNGVKVRLVAPPKRKG